MPNLVVPAVVAAVVVALSIAAFRQRRWPALRLAVILGWLAPLPGYLSVTGLGEPRGLGWLLLYYVSFAVPMFGSYCFGVGLLGGALLGRYTVAPAPGWVRPAAVVVLATGAAAPVILLFRSSPLAWAAVLSAVCCAAGILLTPKLATGGIVMTEKTKWNAVGISIGGLAAVTAILALGLPGSYALPLTLSGIILGGAAGNAVSGRRSQ